MGITGKLKPVISWEAAHLPHTLRHSPRDSTGFSMRFSFREIITLPVAWWIAPLSISNLHDSRSCKIIPGDATWPSEAEWSIFNESVDGRLIKTIPIAQSCHDPHYDESQCAYIRAQWHSSTLQYVAIHQSTKRDPTPSVREARLP